MQGRGKRLFQQGAAARKVAALQTVLEGRRRQGAKDGGILPRIHAEGKNQRPQFAHESAHAGAGSKPGFKLAAPAPGQRGTRAAGAQGRCQPLRPGDGGHNERSFLRRIHTVAEQSQTRAQRGDARILGAGPRGRKDQTAGAQIIFRTGAGMEADGIMPQQGAPFVIVRFPKVENVHGGRRAGQQTGHLAAAYAAETGHKTDTVAQGKKERIGWSVHGVVFPVR